MNKSSSYKDLIIWQRSKDLAIKIYTQLEDFPNEERYSLTQQIKRCSISVPSNIAEGWGRSSDGSFVQFLRIAKGSLFEMQTQLLIAMELKFVSKEVFQEIDTEIDEIGKMINVFISRIKK